MADDVTVTHRPDEQAFVATIGGQRAGVLEAVPHGDSGAWILPHTVVDDEFGGRGVGSALVRATLDHVRGRGERIVPLCSFVAGWLEQHPDEQDLVDDDLLAELSA